MTTREQVSTAIFDLLTALESFQWVTAGRKLRLWSDVQVEERPAMFLVEHHETYARSGEKLRKLTLEYNIFVYLNTRTDMYPSGGAYLNDVLDKIDSALASTGADMLNGQHTNTLGGIVQHCFISGQVIKVPGDLEGDGLLVIPLMVLLP